MTSRPKSGKDISSVLFPLELQYSNFDIERIEKETGSHITPIAVKIACAEVKKFRNLLDTKSGKAKTKKIDEARNSNSFIESCNIIILIQAYKK